MPESLIFLTLTVVMVTTVIADVDLALDLRHTVVMVTIVIADVDLALALPGESSGASVNLYQSEWFV